MSDEYTVIIRGEHREDDGWSHHIEGATWNDIQRGICPDCGGDWIWFEAGYVPGHRKCMGKPIKIEPDDLYPDGKRRTYDPNGGCGSHFSAEPGRNPTIQRARFY